jgi:adenine-specific DNA-methyltransferase
MPNPIGHSGVVLSSDLTFITNEQGQHLGDRFGVLLGDDTRFLDCLVGYFFISGFHRLHPALTNTEKIRILIGIKTDDATYELIQTAKRQQEFVLESHAQVRERVPGEILAELQKSGDSSDIEDGVRKFVEWIKSGKLEVRAYPLRKVTRPRASVVSLRRWMDELLASITVCDLAIGSGAFAVGMMHEIVRARLALAAVEGMPDQTIYQLKRHAIQHSLYGVDFDPGAVEIAKLRLWLSMVVDEDNLREIQPLPNLDYKIMQGNSLLEEFQGVRLLDDKLLQPPDEGRDSQIAEIKSRISSLSQEFVRLHGEGKKSAAAKLTAEQEIKRLKKQVAGLANPDEAKSGGQGELHQQTSWASWKRIQELHEKFFGENSRVEKDKLRRELDALERNFMEATLREQGRSGAIAELKRASVKHRKPFFLWRLQFGEVFQQHGGFDVVIANPPYVRQEEIKEFKEALKRVFECYTGTADLFVYFYERAVKLLRSGGALAFITSNKYYRAGYGEKLRDFLARELTLQQLIDFGDAPVFEAIAYASILTGTRNVPTKDAAALGYTWEKDVAFERIAHVIPERGQRISQTDLKPDGWRLESPVVLRMLDKLRRAGKPLGEYVGGRFYYGIKTGLNEAFVVDRVTRDRLIREHKSSAEILKPFLRGRDVKRWKTEPQDLWLIFTRRGIDIKRYPAIYDHLLPLKKQLVPGAPGGRKPGSYEWYEIQDNIAYWQEFEQPKILYPDIYEHQSFTWDEQRYFAANTCYFIPTNEKWMTGLLNSSAVEWFYGMISNRVRGGYLRAFSDYMKQIPIPVASPEKQKTVERLVDRILAAKHRDAKADTSALEREIDELVYALYGLTPGEIQIVETATALASGRQRPAVE